MSGKGLRFGIMGAGGVGGYFGASLAKSGADVVMIARNAHLAKIQEAGLRVETAEGAFSAPVTATDDPAQAGPCDVVLVAVKLWDTETAVEAISPMVGPETTVISLQNGIGAEPAFAARYGQDRVFGGVAQISATISAPGTIAKHSGFARIVFGELGQAQPDRTAALVEAFTQAGIETKHSTDIQAELWRKFIFLVALSGATAVTGKPIGEVLSNTEDRALFEALVKETHALSQAKAIGLAPETPAQVVTFAEGLPHAMRASMAHDLIAGNRLELDWLSGAVVRMARELGVPAPANAGVVDVLSA
ncbi:2-dehydropantoate 2-reductase [Hwanghaeella grinnelliae]|uniref:2-dehydropantoate 2-reductase n=1 Tax=Hwanghaeella grinnelliae TaxID=2500179 RepID=A0A437QJY9_9PROT|nr:2-dehydropantoate 2-reductase [Hwanghaeella grinnelliae]RVU34824.1 2-dehydropantoate 2-reductase [Hwanghaeella grinnelliae]